MDIIKQANEVYNQNFKPVAWFGRCIFLSWYCDVGTCEFCFRSTQKHKIRHAKTAKRTVSSLLVDAILGKHLGWRIEFLTGGYRIFSFEEMVDITKKISHIYNQKIWINLGTLEKEQLETLRPYVEGICASIETIEPELHNKICPDKPIEPYTEMLNRAGEMGFKKSMTIVVGLGEKKEDFEILKQYIKDNNMDRITFYALKPVVGTPFKHSPEPDYYAWWIAKTRIEFPKLEIIAGLTPKHPEFAELILKAGANAITKFPVVKQFNSEKTKLITEQVKSAGREFMSNLTTLPDIDWHAYVDNLPQDLFSEKLKGDLKEKLDMYLTGMKKKR